MPPMGDISDDEDEADDDGFMAARDWEEHIAWLRSKSREALFSEDSEDDEDDEQESAGVRFRGKSATQNWWESDLGKKLNEGYFETETGRKEAPGRRRGICAEHNVGVRERTKRSETFIGNGTAGLRGREDRTLNGNRRTG